MSKSIPAIYTGDPVFGIISEGEKVWVSSLGGGLLQYDKNLLLNRRFKHEPGDPFSIQTDSLTTLFKYKGEDTIWVCSTHGVQILNTNTLKFSRLLFFEETCLIGLYCRRNCKRQQAESMAWDIGVWSHTI